MKPYASRGIGKDDVGCCPGHDWPRTYRWSGRYSSKNSRRTDASSNLCAKRIRRHVDKAILMEEVKECLLETRLEEERRMEELDELDELFAPGDDYYDFPTETWKLF